LRECYIRIADSRHRQHPFSATPIDSALQPPPEKVNRRAKVNYFTYVDEILRIPTAPFVVDAANGDRGD
jgi:hypothetical protein